MIQHDFKNLTYTCPFCGHAQAYGNSYDIIGNGKYKNISPIPDKYQESSFMIYTFYCSNTSCGRASVMAINKSTHKQIDILPQVVIKQWPSYIPQQIRQDYEEASTIIGSSPKAAATLLRRCLQGMIHDYWNIHEKNLNAEITALNNKVTPAQWNALDGLRKIGNIGAHMENDVNLIVDIDVDEAKKLLRLIELLLEKWYVARHDEEELLKDITEIADAKETKRKEK